MDHLVLTIDQSVNLFWKARWSFNKILFLVNRYASLITMITIILESFTPRAPKGFCTFVAWFELCGCICLIITIGVTMIIRVYALWNRSRPVLYLVLSMFFAHLGTYSSMMAYSLATATITSNTPPFTGCMVMPTWDKAWITFTTSIALETLLFILIVAGSYPIVRQRGMKAPFYSLLFEDGLAYYSIVIISQVISFIALKVYTPVTATFLGSYPTVAIIGIACGRLLLRPQRLLLGYGAETSDSFRSDGLRTADDITLEFPNRKAESYMTRDLPGERLKAMDEDGDTFELGTPSGSNTISIPNRLSPNREIG